MPPDIGSQTTGVLLERDASIANYDVTNATVPCAASRPRKVVWLNVFVFLCLHLAALYGLYLIFTSAKVQTNLFMIFTSQISGLGITAGAHRLWSHKSYKAKTPLRILLTIFNTIALQNSVIEWVRDHRMHHKYSETDADPHNATRGFFFSHIGWLLVKKHPAIKEKGGTIDNSDLWSDPILRFQHKYYFKLALFACFVLPTVIPVYCWSESWTNAFFTAAVFRYILGLNVTWLINSAAHKWGDKPYDQHISPVETKIVSFFALGEGFHNYHHTFPWDYKTSELGDYTLNSTTLFIDLMARIGWAYDLKTVSPGIIEKRVKRTGDGSHDVWGWDDKDMPKDEKRNAIIYHRAKQS